MSDFEDDPYLAADRRSHWWQAALVTVGILATVLVALLRHGRERTHEREAEAAMAVAREMRRAPPPLPDGWSEEPRSAWSPAGPSRDAPAVELELIAGGRHDDITDASVSIAGQDYELRALPRWTFSSPSLSLTYDSTLRARATAHGVALAARASIAGVELVDTGAAPAAWVDAIVASYRDAGIATAPAEAFEVSLLGRRTTGRRLSVGDSRVEVVAAPAGRGRMLQVMITGARDDDDDAAIHAALASVRLRRLRPTPEFELVPLEEVAEAEATIDLAFTEDADAAAPPRAVTPRAARPVPVTVGVPIKIAGQTVTIARRAMTSVQRGGFHFDHPASMLLLEGETARSPMSLHEDDLLIQIVTTPGLRTLDELARDLAVADVAAATVEVDGFSGLRTIDAATGTVSVTFAFARDARAFAVTATAPPGRLDAVLDLAAPVLATLR